MELFMQLLMLIVGVYDSIIIIMLFVKMLKLDGVKISCTYKESLIFLPIPFFIIIGKVFDVNYFYTYNLLFYLVTELLIGLAFTWHYISLKIIGSSWSDSEKTKKSGKLIKNGVYSIVRHPIYTAFFIEGVSAAFISFYTLGFAVALCFIPFYRLLILKEEENLIQAYAEEYTEYMSIVKYKLIPFIW